MDPLVDSIKRQGRKLSSLTKPLLDVMLARHDSSDLSVDLKEFSHKDKTDQKSNKETFNNFFRKLKRSKKFDDNGDRNIEDNIRNSRSLVTDGRTNAWKNIIPTTRKLSDFLTKNQSNDTKLEGRQVILRYENSYLQHKSGNKPYGKGEKVVLTNRRTKEMQITSVHHELNPIALPFSSKASLRSNLFGENEDLVKYPLTADRDFLVPQIMSIRLDQFQLMMGLDERPGIAQFMGLISVQELKERQRLTETQRVRIKILFKKTYESSRLHSRRFFNQLAIYCHFTSSKTRSRAPKLLAFHHSENLYMISTTLHACDLQTFIESRFARGKNECLRGIKPVFVLNAMMSIALALKELHQLGFVHRNVCPSSMFVEIVSERYNNTFKVLIDGFDRCELVEASDSSTVKANDIEVDELAYFSPELVSHILQSPHSTHKRRSREEVFKTDIYSFGKLCYFLLEQQHPHYGSGDQIMSEISDKFITPIWTKRASDILRAKHDMKLFDSIIGLIEGCWNYHPQQRPSSSILVPMLHRLNMEVSKKKFERKNEMKSTPQVKQLKRLIVH